MSVSQDLALLVCGHWFEDLDQRPLLAQGVALGEWISRSARWKGPCWTWTPGCRRFWWCTHPASHFALEQGADEQCQELLASSIQESGKWATRFVHVFFGCLLRVFSTIKNIILGLRIWGCFCAFYNKLGCISLTSDSGCLDK